MKLHFKGRGKAMPCPANDQACAAS
jgi:hypothetical protein